LRCANVGHDLPYVWHGGDAEELRSRVMPLGLMLGISYKQKEMVLEADEIALFYSDGLVEAHNPYGEIFGFPRLLLQEDLHPFTGEGWEQEEDDITLLTLRRLIA
jgi:serine phosphatase RsbU (regulator of sigma subunit)